MNHLELDRVPLFDVESTDNETVDEDTLRLTSQPSLDSLYTPDLSPTSSLSFPLEHSDSNSSLASEYMDYSGYSATTNTRPRDSPYSAPLKFVHTRPVTPPVMEDPAHSLGSPLSERSQSYSYSYSPIIAQTHNNDHSNGHGHIHRNSYSQAPSHSLAQVQPQPPTHHHSHSFSYSSSSALQSSPASNDRYLTMLLGHQYWGLLSSLPFETTRRLDCHAAKMCHAFGAQEAQARITQVVAQMQDRLNLVGPKAFAEFDKFLAYFDGSSTTYSHGTVSPSVLMQPRQLSVEDTFRNYVEQEFDQATPAAMEGPSMPQTSLSIPVVPAAAAAAAAAAPTLTLVSPMVASSTMLVSPESPIVSPTSAPPTSAGTLAGGMAARRIHKEQWVRLSEMRPERIAQILQGTRSKGIEEEAAQSMLQLFQHDLELSTDSEVYEFRHGHKYVRVITGQQDDGSPKTGTKRKRRHNNGDDHIKRPLNSFMLYRRAQTKAAMYYGAEAGLKLNHQSLSQVIAFMWRTEDKSVQGEFHELSGQEREMHKEMHPEYKFRPQKQLRRRDDDE